MRVKLFLRLFAYVLLVPVTLTPGANAAGKFKVLHSFTGGKDGGGPLLFSPLAMDAEGDLFGPMAGGSLSTKCQYYGCGAVFEMKRGTGGLWTEVVVFEITDPQTQGQIASPLSFDSQGNLYGCTGQYTSLTFELTPGSVGWAFNAISPLGCLGAVGPTLGRDGNLYSAFGQTIGELMPIQLSSSAAGWDYVDLYNFCWQGKGCPDGERPLAPLSWDSEGNL